MIHEKVTDLVYDTLLTILDLTNWNGDELRLAGMYYVAMLSHAQIR